MKNSRTLKGPAFFVELRGNPDIIAIPTDVTDKIAIKPVVDKAVNVYRDRYPNQFGNLSTLFTQMLPIQTLK
jgi:hypothetical protein